MRAVGDSPAWGLVAGTLAELRAPLEVRSLRRLVEPNRCVLALEALSLSEEKPQAGSRKSPSRVKGGRSYDCG
jgi:hypothetical protein